MQKQRKRAENTAKRVLFVFVSEKRPVSTGRVRESEAKKEISFALEPSGSCKSEIKIRIHLEVNPYFFLEVRRVELLSKITSMHVPTSVPFAFNVSSYPRPRRSARSLTSLVNLGRRPQA